MQILAISEDDRQSQSLSPETNRYFAAPYGICTKCSNSIQSPGLDHSYCPGCNDWIATWLILDLTNAKRGASIENPPVSIPDVRHPSNQALSRPDLKPTVSQQLDLWGGRA